MTVKHHYIEVSTRGFNDIVDISALVFEKVKESKIKNGNVLVFCPGSTCGITTIEYESGCISDFKDFFERNAPQNIEYKHNLRWGDGNGFSHVRAALLKASFVFPIIENEPVLGTWQQIVLVDFDNNPRNRKVIVQITGE